MPHGLKVSTHLSPVLRDFSEIKKKRRPLKTRHDCILLQVLLKVPVVDYLYGSVLLNPQFPQDDVVHAAHWICPGVCFLMSAGKG